MDITIGQTMRMLRSRKKNTQEQLAAHLGVTVQAVSKWERGEGYPDIAILPAIAAYYNVTVDHLLGVDQQVRQKKLDEYKAESKVLAGPGNTSARVELWRKAYREFPNEPTVLHNLAFSLRADSLTDHAVEIISLSERLLKEATQSGEYFGAINNLCRAYKCLGNPDEAKRYASMAGRYIGTENQLMIHLLEGDEAAAFCKWNIETLVDLIASNTGVMLKKGSFSPQEQIQIAQHILGLFDWLCDDGNYGFYHCRISKWALILAKCHAGLKNRDETLRWLHRAIGHALQFDSLRDGVYTAPMVRNAKIHATEATGRICPALHKTLAEPCFDFLRHEEAFQKDLTSLPGA